MSDADCTPTNEIDPKIKDARERRLRWYYKNKERASAANKAWCQANREKKNKSRREWAKKPGNRAKLNAVHASWKKRNPEHVAAKAKEYRIRQKDHLKFVSRRSHLRREYGMTVTDYENLFKAQQGKCAICGTTDPFPSPCLCVDHCHRTGVVRGLLCFNCNISIGRMNDDPALLLAAIRYLKRTTPRGKRAAPPDPG